MATISARSLKATIVLNSDDFITMPATNGVPRVHLVIRLPDRTVTADLSAKSVRKAQVVIEAAGDAGCAVILQGKLLAGDVLAEAGLSAQPRKPVTAVTEAAA